jgi:hypothetical protein
MLYKFVEPDTNVVALKVVKLESPDAVIELNEGDEETFTIGLFAVPPVVILEPGCTLVISFPLFVVKKISYKFVPADRIVPALIEVVTILGFTLIVIAELVPEIEMLAPDVIPDTTVEIVLAVRIDEYLLNVLRFIPSCSNLASAILLAFPPLKFISAI